MLKKMTTTPPSTSDSLPTIHGKPYTQLISTFEDKDEIPLQNKWDDSVLVHVEENCSLDEFMYKHINKRYAK